MAPTLRLRMIPLGSGSSGNCTVVTDGKTTVMIDCGFSAAEVSRRLTSAGISPSDVDAILVTHEHGDHVRGLEVFCRRHACGTTVYSSRGTRAAAGLDRLDAEKVTLSAGSAVRVGTLEVIGFRTSHDCAEPFGYRVVRDGESVGIATDTGAITAEVAEGLAGCSIIAIESNHDLLMLERGPYPTYLKRRILSVDGHLSNADAAAALERIASGSLRQVFGMHRSETNNTSRLALNALRGALGRIGLDVPVAVAAQHSPTAG